MANYLCAGMALYGEKEWYFFSPRDRKYPNGSRPNRAAGAGYWKATGADKPVGTPKPLAIKKALVFYAGKAPKGEKTNWIMHEYRLADVDRSARKKNSLRVRTSAPPPSVRPLASSPSKSNKKNSAIMCRFRNERGDKRGPWFWAAEFFLRGPC
jgi:hypothetical protein